MSTSFTYEHTTVLKALEEALDRRADKLVPTKFLVEMTRYKIIRTQLMQCITYVVFYATRII